MTELDRLPPDQRAVLSLVLDRGKSYGEVAEMLAIPESAVRDRAHAALDALANDPAGPGDSRPPAPARAAAGGASSAAGTGPSSASSLPPPRPRDTRAPLTAPSSRTGGALLLGAIVAVIVVVVILISGGGGKSSSSTTTTTASNTQSTTTASAGKPSLNKTIALTPIEPAFKATGKAYVLSQSGRHAFYVAARGLPPSSGFFYAVWLYNSPSSSAALGRAPTVGSDGRMEGGGPLPTNAGLYHQLIITRETSTHPSHPGEIVLRGTFGLH
jgi:Sigma-70, region 4